MLWWKSWRLAIRMNWRGLRAAPVQSLLLVALVALPVAAGVAYAGVDRSAVPTPERFAERYMGTAQIIASPGTQLTDVRRADDVARLVRLVGGAAGPGSTVTPDFSLPARFSSAAVTGKGDERQVGGSLRLLDLNSPLTRGMYRVESSAGGQGAGISAALMRRLGQRVGQEIFIASLGRTVRIATVLVDPHDTEALFLVTAGTPDLYAAVYAPRGEVDPADTVVASILVGTSDLRSTLAAVQSAGMSTITRDEVKLEIRNLAAAQSDSLSILAVLVMLLAEISFLVAAAMTIAARRRRRELGLLAAAGAGPRVRRRVIVANGVLIGALSAMVAVPLGVGLGALANPAVQRASHQAWGDYRIDPVVTSVAPVLAALVATLAAWLTGRAVASATTAESLRLGHARAAVGRSGRWAVAASVLAAAVLGLGVAENDQAVIVTGTVMVVLALLTGFRWLLSGLRTRVIGWSLPARLAVRDASSDPGRTVALAAAIAVPFLVTVLVTTYLGSLALDAARVYVPTGRPGTTIFTAPQAPPETNVQRAAEALQARRVAHGVGLGLPFALTGGQVDIVTATVENAIMRCVESGPPSTDSVEQSARVQTCIDRHPEQNPNPEVAAVDENFVAIVLGRELTAAERSAFAAGTALVVDPGVEVRSGAVQLRQLGLPQGSGGAAPIAGPRLPALAVPNIVPGNFPSVLLKATRVSGTGTGLRPVAKSTIMFEPAQMPDESAEDLARAVLSSGDGTSELTVERGPQGERIILQILTIVVALLMIGTLVVVATAVALSAGQLRQDFSTLAAVGAAPRLRRRIVAAQSGGLAAAGVGIGIVAGSLGAAVLVGAAGDELWPWGWVIVSAGGAVSVLAAVAVGSVSVPRLASLHRRPG